MPADQLMRALPYALAALLAVGIGLRWAGAHRAGATPAASASSRFSTPSGGARSSSPALTRAPAQASVVHVAGAVRRAGVYRLAGGARVIDAIRRAGGLTSAADSAAVNLAAKLVDGQQVLVPRRAAASSPAAAAAPGVGGTPSTPAAPVSLSSATAEQLDTLPGVGPATAAKIIAWRTEHGGFASVDDLAQVPGIGPGKLEALRSQVTT